MAPEGLRGFRVSPLWKLTIGNRNLTALWHHDCMYANAEAGPGQLPLRRAFCLYCPRGKGAHRTMKSGDEQLTWAKQRALICVDMGRFADAVAGLRRDLAENPLTKGLISSDQALRGYKAASDAALGRGSQALTEWIEGLR